MFTGFQSAQPSPTAASLLKSLGMKDMDKYMTKPSKNAKKKKATEEEAAAKFKQKVKKLAYYP